MNEKINILSDFRLILMKLKLDMNFQYIFLVKPKENQIGEVDSLSDRLAQIREMLEDNTSKVIETQSESFTTVNN